MLPLVTLLVALLVAQLVMPLVALLVLLSRGLRGLLRLLRVRRMTAALPGPRGWPLLGALPHLPCPTEDVYDRLQALCREHGPVFRVLLGHLTFVVVAEPGDLEAVLPGADMIQSPALDYATGQMLGGTGLSSLTGEPWRQRRAAIASAMHLQVIKGFMPAMHRNALKLSDKLAALADEGRTVDVEPLLLDSTHRTICETMLSTEVDDDDPVRQRFLEAIPRSQYHAIYRTCRPWLLSEWLYSFTDNYADYVQVKKDLEVFAQKIVRERKEKLSRLADEPCAMGKRPHLAFLDQFLTPGSKDSLSESEVVEEVKTLACIGSGSSTKALTFTLYALAARQDIQEKVKQELDEVLGGRPPEASDVPRLQYLECVLREVLRYFNVSPYFGRVLPRDVKLPVSGHVLPEGCNVVVWAPYVHMDPRWHPEPRRFDPERFLPERSAGRRPFTLLAFGGGQRQCIGQRFTMVALATVVATLVSRLHFALPEDAPAAARRLEDLPLALTIFTSLRHGAALRVSRRRTAERC